MRLEWIEDLLAILRTGSLSRAAERRFLTQPAFSRRVRSIEEYIGVELIDRARKPVQLRPAILDQQERLETLASELHELINDLRQNERQASNRIVIACQHAITASIAPQLIVKIGERSDEVTVRLRSDNRAECFALLVTKQADLMLTYRLPGEILPVDSSFLEEMSLGEDVLVPVFSGAHRDIVGSAMSSGTVPIVAYPPDVFFGEVMAREILPPLRAAVVTRERAETALTLAALQLALAGVGVAWIPRSLATAHLQDGSLIELDDPFGKAVLHIDAVRLASPKSTAEWHVWHALGGFAAKS